MPKGIYDRQPRLQCRKLIPEDIVLKILEDLDKGMFVKDVTAKYKVSWHRMNNQLHIKGKYRKRRFTAEQVRAWRADVEAGRTTCYRIAKDLGEEPGTIYKIVSYQAYKEVR